MKPALLAIDLQKCYCEGRGEFRRASSERACESLNEAATFFRGAGFPVVAIYHEDVGTGPGPGDPRYEFIEALRVGTPDLTIHKRHGNAFFETDLAERLRALGVDTLVVAGYCAEYCVLSTYRRGEERGFKALLLRGALASGDPAHLEFVERIEESATLGALKALLA